MVSAKPHHMTTPAALQGQPCSRLGPRTHALWCICKTTRHVSGEFLRSASLGSRSASLGSRVVTRSDGRCARTHRQPTFERAAIFLFVVFFSALPASVSQAQTAKPDDSADAATARKKEARERFLHGLELAKDGDCKFAVVEFETSYALYPRPNTLYNVAQCRQTLHDYPRAVAAYNKYLAVAPPDAADRPAVQATLLALNKQIGRLTITSNVSGRLSLDGKEVGSFPGTLVLPAGSHRLKFQSQGHTGESRVVEVAGESKQTIQVTLEPVRQRRAPVRKEFQPEPADNGLSQAFFWTGLGATVAAAAGGTYFGLKAQSLRDDAQGLDPRLSRTDEREKINQTALTADLLFVGAGVLGASTAVLYFFTDWSSKEASPSADHARAELRPSFAPQGASLTLQGSF